MFFSVFFVISVVMILIYEAGLYAAAGTSSNNYYQLSAKGLIIDIHHKGYK